MRIVHFSDIHFAAWTHDLTAFLDKRILGLLNYLLRRRGKLHEEYVDKAFEAIARLNPDLVVCTGDVTCVGSPEEFSKARSKLQALASCPVRDFVYIPGNHDAYVPRKSCKTALEHTFRALNEHLPDLADFPFEMRYDNARLWLINTARPTIITSSAGFLTPATTAKLQEWMADERADNEVRVLIGHYPTADAAGRTISWRRRLHGGEQLHSALIRGDIDLSLCGHIHDCFVRKEASGSLEVCAGSLTMNARLNVVDIDRTQRKWSQWWEEL